MLSAIRSAGLRVRQLSQRVRSDSAILIMPPGPPTSPTAVADSDTQITVNWTDPAGPITSYDGRYRIGAGAWTEVLGIAKPWVVMGLTTNTDYGFEVRANNSGGIGEWSAEATATTLPVAPTLTVTPTETTVAPTYIALGEWTYPTDPDSFRIEVSIDGVSGWVELTSPAGSNRSANIVPDNTGQEFYFRIFAIVSGIDSLPSNVVLIAAAPTVTAATITDPTTIAVTSDAGEPCVWQYSNDGGASWIEASITAADGDLFVGSTASVTHLEVSGTTGGNRTWFSEPFVVPWNPAAQLGLSLYLDELHSSYHDNPPVNLCTAGQTILSVKALYGTTINAVQTTVAQQPVWRTDGAEFDVPPVLDVLPLDSPVALTGDFTAYYVFSRVSGADIWPLAAQATLGGTGILGNTFYVLNDAGGGGTFGSTNPAGLVLARLRRSGSTVYLTYTGTAEANIAAAGTITLDCVGERFNVQWNGDVNNRHQLQAIIGSNLTPGGADDLAWLAWINTNFGVTL